MTLKDYKTKFSCKPKQRPVITRKLKEIIQETNQAFMIKISKNLVTFSFDLRWIALFLKILKALHKFKLKNLTVKIFVPMVIALRASLHDHVLFILCTGRMNIALDNVIIFSIKVIYTYSVFLEDSDHICYLYGCYIFKKKIV